MSKSLGIVVGVDGSESAQQALAWALAEAQLRQRHVTALHGWDYNYYPAGVLVQADTLEPRTRKMVNTAVDPWRDQYPDLSIEKRVVRKSSGAAALKEASRDAELIVVGSRGHGGVAGMLLGSVSNAIAQTAHCPVVVVHGER